MGLTAESNHALTAKQLKAIARLNHAQLQHPTTYHPIAKQSRRTFNKDNVVIISAALAVTTPCTCKTKDFILSTQEKIREAALNNIRSITELTHHTDGRLIRHEGRVAITEVLTLFIYRTDIKTLKVGTPGIDGKWFGLSYADIAQQTKLTLSAVKRALKKIVNAGIVHCHQQVLTFKDEHDETKREYRQLANLYTISQDFLKKLGMLKYWQVESQNSKHQSAQARQEAQERAGEKAALERLGLAATNEVDASSIKLKKVKTTTYHDVNTGQSHTKTHTQQTDDHENTTTTGRADFIKLKKMFGS